MSRLLPVVLSLGVSSALPAESGSFAILFDGDALPGSRVTLSAFAAGDNSPGVSYEREFIFGGQDAGRLREVILADLRRSGWVVASNDSPGVTIVAHNDGDGVSRALSRVGIVDNDASVNASVGSLLYYGETDLRNSQIHFGFTGGLTSDTSPGTTVLLFDDREIRVDLPPSSTPAHCATLLEARMAAEGLDVARLNGEVVFEWRGQDVFSLLEIEFVIEGGGSGPATHLQLPRRIACEAPVFMGISREALRGADAFEGILGVDLQRGVCATMATLNVTSDELTLFGNIVSSFAPDRTGASAWTVAIAVDDGEVIDATLQGTAAASVTCRTLNPWSARSRSSPSPWPPPAEGKSFSFVASAD